MRVPLVAVAVLTLVAACGGGNTATTGPLASVAATPETCTGSGGTPVAIANLAFSPQSVTVAVGAVVTWANADSVTHTVTFNEGPDCGNLAQGASVSRTFGAAGTFAYHCAIHATMRGTVVVQ